MSKFDNVKQIGEDYAKGDAVTPEPLDPYIEAVGRLVLHICENWQTCRCANCKRKRDILDPMRLYFKEAEEKQ